MLEKSVNKIFLSLQRKQKFLSNFCIALVGSNIDLKMLRVAGKFLCIATLIYIIMVNKIGQQISSVHKYFLSVMTSKVI